MLIVSLSPTAREPLASPQASDTGQVLSMLEYTAPEDASPEASFAGNSLLKASAIRRMDGRMKNLTPSDELQTPVNIVSSSTSAYLLVEVSSERPPASLKLRSFRTMSEDGIQHERCSRHNRLVHEID